MFLEEINLNFIQPCTTDSKRIRIIATPSKDVSELFPYLKTYLDYIKDFINDCYDKKDSIKPSDEKRNLPSPFDVYEILPRLNCGKCGESTCMAFAAKLVQGKYKPNMCSQVRAEGHESMREELENIYLTLGYKL